MSEPLGRRDDGGAPSGIARHGVHGDLEGTAHLTLLSDHDTTIVTAAWTIKMMQRSMRLADRVAHPLLRWGHDRVVDATVESFRRNVESRR